MALFPASHDVRRGDSLEVLTGSFIGTYRVEDIERRNDGAEAVATLIV
jgi:ribosomal 50S subunit-recycling heat shock protein